MYLFAETGFTTLIALAALALTIGFLLLRSHRYFARQQDMSPIIRVQRPQADQRGHHVGAPEEMLRWEVEMHDIARDLSAQLDSKMGALEHLIREADRVAGRLEAALAADSRQGAADSGQGAAGSGRRGVGSWEQAKPGTLNPEPRTLSPDLPQASHPDPLPANQAEKLKSANPVDHGSGRQEVCRRDAAQGTSAEYRYEEIYLLADYGFDATEIARRVGSPVGEVELILGLRDKR